MNEDDSEYSIVNVALRLRNIERLHERLSEVLGQVRHELSEISGIAHALIEHRAVREWEKDDAQEA